MSTGATETFLDTPAESETTANNPYTVFPDNGFANFPQQIGLSLNSYASPLQIEIPQEKRDNKFISNDLLAQVCNQTVWKETCKLHSVHW